MAARRGAGLLLLAVAAHSALVWPQEQDVLSLVQQTLESSTYSSFLSSRRVSGYEIGESLQVKLDGTNAWVDCIIIGQSGMLNRYDIYVPSMGGTMQERTFHDVHSQMIRQVGRDFQVYMEKGPNATQWLNCSITGRGEGDSWNIELTDGNPGYSMTNVPPHLLRDGRERLEKAQHFDQLFHLNEAAVSQLFYSAEVKLHQKHIEGLAKKAQEDQAEMTYKAARQYAWQEMAKQAEKEEQERKFKEEAEKKRKETEKAIKEAREKAATDKLISKMSTAVAENPMVALMINAQKLKLANREKEKEEKKKSLAEMAEKRRVREQQEREAEEHRLEMDAQRAVLRKAEEEAKKAKPELTEEGKALVASRMQAFEETEVARSQRRKSLQEDMQKLSQLEAQKYQQVEKERMLSVGERRKVNARKNLLRMLQGMEDTEGSKNIAGARRELREALKEAEGAELEASEIDPARLMLVKMLSSSAREGLARSMKLQRLVDMQATISDCQSKAAEVDRLWNSIEDEEGKRGVSQFEVSEMETAKSMLPELQKREVGIRAARARITVAKRLGKVDDFKQAIEAAEKAGMPDEELDKERDQLEDKQVFPGILHKLRDARDNDDIERLRAAIQEGEAAGMPSWRIKGFKHALQDLLSPPEKVSEEQPTKFGLSFGR